MLNKTPTPDIVTSLVWKYAPESSPESIDENDPRVIICALNQEITDFYFCFGYYDGVYHLYDDLTGITCNFYNSATNHIGEVPVFWWAYLPGERVTKDAQ